MDPDPERNSILIISHDPPLENFLKAYLAHYGHPIFCSEKKNETQALIRKLTPALVVLDSIPSEAEWGDLDKAVQGLKPRPAFLILTDSRRMESKGAFFEGNGLEYMRRPFDSRELGEKVQQLLANVNGVPGLEENDGQGMKVSIRAGRGYLSRLIIGSSKKLEETLGIIDRVAETDVAVLIRGESGTGKELAARAIHDRSARRDKPFIKVHCPAIPENLLESELFGYEKGAFTGAFRRKPGRFEFANDGTIFLDEIGDMPWSLQAKLLQVLQEGEFARIGGQADIKVNVRIIAVTNKDLDKAVREGSFREDLFYRLSVVNIHMPPLRDRKEDTAVLVHYFLDRFNREFNRKARLSKDTLRLFTEYHWPGNVRELEHTVKAIVILGNESGVVRQLRSKLQLQHHYPFGQNVGHARSASSAISSAPHAYGHQQRPLVNPSAERRRQERRRSAGLSNPSSLALGPDPTSLKSVSRDAARTAEEGLIKSVLVKTHWNRKEAAKALGISYKALLYKVKQFRKVS